MITAMTELIIFWTAALITAAILAALREVYSDDPTGSTTYRPPASHHPDDFSRHGSSFR